MSEELKNAPPGLYWKLVIVELILELITPVLLSTLAVLDEKDWATLSPQGKWMAIFLIIGLSIDKIKPILKDAAKRIRTSQPFDSDTVMIKKMDPTQAP